MLKNALLIVVSICIAFLAGEFGIRILGIVEERSDILYQPDAVLHHSFIPKKTGLHISPVEEYRTEVTINDLGLRDDNFPIEKPRGVHRTLLLGDSFLAAIGLTVILL